MTEPEDQTGPMRVRRVVSALLAVGLVAGVLVVPRLDLAGEAGSGVALAQSSGGLVTGAVGAPADGGRGVDDVGAVVRSVGLVTGGPLVVSGSGDGLGCLDGDSEVGDGCVVAQLEPRITASSECVGLGGEFLVRVGSVNGAGVVSFAYPVSAQAGVVPTTLVTDGEQGQSFSWAFSPESATADCPAPTAGSWRTFRVDVIRAGVEESVGFGPVRVGLSSGSATVRVSSTSVGLVSGPVDVGLSYRSPGGVGYVSQDPAESLPGGWALDGLGQVAPWVSATQSGTGSVPAAVVLTAFDGQQVEFTNTVAGSGATGGVWAAPTQAGWSSGQFGSLVDSGDLTAADSTLTWSSGQQVVTFEKSAAGVWDVVESEQVEPSGLASPSVRAEWDTSVSPPRLARLTDPGSNKQVTFRYGSGGTCDGVAPPTDGSDTYVVPDGLLCGWENFDGRTSNVWYVKVADSAEAVEAFQVGWVATPGGSNTQLFWASDGGESAPQLQGVQPPLGHDAQTKAGLSESDTLWRVNYDVFGNVASVVSPKPGVGSVVSGANEDRIARVFTYNNSQGVQWTSINHGVVADQDDPSSVSLGASIVDEVRFDGAWRPVRYAVASSRPGTSNEFFFVNKTWDTVNDRLLATEGPNERQTVSKYDYLGRVVERWGPAPVSSFTTNSRGEIVPASGFGNDNLISGSVSFDADEAGTLAGLTVSTYASSSPGGIPAASLGSCAEGQCAASDAPPLTWTVLPSTANVTGGGWSLNAVASREAPVDGDLLQYRVSTDSGGTVLSFSAAGSCNTDPTSSTCADTVAVPASTSAGQPVTLQVQYQRTATTVSDTQPVEITIEESTDGGSTWTALTARDLDPGFGLTSSNTQHDTFSTGGGVEQIRNRSVFADPQRQQVASATVTSDSVDASTGHTYENYNGTSTWGRTLNSTDFAGATVAAAYWGPTATTTNPCDGTTTESQAGLQSLFTMPATGTGDPTGMSMARVYDTAGRTVAQTHSSQDGQADFTMCRTFDDRDRPLSMATTDNTLTVNYTYPWNDPDGTDPFTITTTHTAPDTTGATQTYTGTSVTDLLGRNVATTDMWGTTTITNVAINPTTGVQTSTAIVTTAAGFTMTDTVTINADGTTASMVRDDGTTTLTTTYAYNDDSTINTITLTNGSTEVVTETRGYDTTTGIHNSSTWTQGSTTIATDTLTDAPNAIRVLQEQLAVGGVTYTWDYTYGGLSRLTGAELASSDNSITGDWTYTFTEDTNTQPGENPDAYLNGNITTKTTTLNGTTETVDYHYDYADRLTRTTDPNLQNLTYDSFDNLTTIGANTITYNTVNSPVAVTDGTTTVNYTRLINYPIIEKTTTNNGTSTTIRYSANGLILNTNGDTLSHIHQLGPITITTPTTAAPVDVSYQLNTLRGHRFLTLNANADPTTTTPVLFDPYGTQLTNPTNSTVDNPDTPNYAWHATNTAETETLELPYVMMGARVYIPELGRFTSPDPIPTASASEYSYARSDPINFTDPNGLSPKHHRSFGDWLKVNFVDFWTHHLRNAFHATGHWIHQHATLIATIALVTVIVVAFIAVTILTDGAADELLIGPGGDLIFDATGDTVSDAIGDLGDIDFDSDPEAGLDSDEDASDSDDDGDYGHSPYELDIADYNTDALEHRIETMYAQDPAVSFFEESDEYTGVRFANVN